MMPERTPKGMAAGSIRNPRPSNRTDLRQKVISWLSGASWPSSRPSPSSPSSSFSSLQSLACETTPLEFERQRDSRPPKREQYEGVAISNASTPGFSKIRARDDVSQNLYFIDIK